MANFFESLLPSLIGFGLVYPLLMRVRYGRWEPWAAILIEVATFALGIAFSQIVFGFYPQLREGWEDWATRIVVIWLFVLPGWYLASRIRRTHAV